MLEGSILHRLKTAHQMGQVGRRPLNFGVYYKNTLVALCHALEDYILSCSSAPLVVTAFQRGKWYLQEADRYADLAARSHQIVIMAAPDAGFAEHPTSQMANVELVNLNPADPVAQEWHLMILAPTYAAMVLCQELSEADYGPQGPPEQDLARKFFGLWTFETNLVRETIELAIDHLQTYNPDLAAKLTQQLQTIVNTQTAQQDDLSPVVAQVVDYLQASEHELSDHAAVLPPEILGSNLISNEVQAFLRMAQLTDQADLLNPTATAEVASLIEAMGQLLDLPVWQMHRLKLAALLHRLAPLQRSDTVLTPSRHLDAVDDAAPSCPLVPGGQVLRRMPQLRAVATIITHQTERWDGSGYPAHLAGDDIPLESRILGLVADFQQRVAAIRATTAGSDEPDLEAALTQALAESQAGQGTQWDPKLVEVLALLVGGMRQGMSLPINLPKISAGLWLVDSHCGDDLFQAINSAIDPV